MIPLRTELWPFSSYPMFNVRFDAPDETVYELFASNVDGTISVPIHDQRILGPIKDGYLSRYCRAKIKSQEPSCLQSSLQFWARRYLSLETRLAPELRGFTTLKLVETLSKTEVASESLERTPR